MFHINPVNYGDNNYRMVRTNKKVMTVDNIERLSNDRNRNGSDSSNFGQNLQDEKQKLKSKIKKKNH